ncbi:cobalamin-dependent protein, partial [bacterium]|nr:cobalamin-dependent protein [bacterium]
MNVVFVYAAFEQLGLEYISSFLKSKGHKTKLVFDPLLFADGYLDIPFLNKLFSYTDYVTDRVKNLNPDIVGISSVTDNYLWGCLTAANIKKKLDVPIVFGGIHSTSVPDRVIQNDFADFVVVGEGEYPLLDIVTRMETGGNLHDIPNVWSKKNGLVIKNDVRDLIEDLNALPLPDKDLFFDESPPMADEYRIVTCHGACPNQCTYCCNHIRRRIYKGKGKYLRR